MDLKNTDSVPYRMVEKTGVAVPPLTPYLRGLYHFGWLDVEGQVCLAMRSRVGELLPFPYLGKHVEQVAARLEANVFVVLFAERIPLRMQQRLVREGIPFVTDSGSCFLPFLGIRTVPEKTRQKQRITPLAQQLALWHVLTGDECFYAHGLAERFGVSAMAISNACAALVATGVYSRKKDGRLLILQSEKGRGAALFAALRPFLASPVAGVGYLRREDVPPAACTAGESALSHYSRLAAPPLPCVAVLRSRAKGLALMPEMVDEASCCRVELWKYDPSFLGKEGVVDRLSLYLAIPDDGDPRLHQALEELLQIEA